MKNQIIILAFTFIVSSLIAQQKGINQLPTANRQLPTSTYAVVVGISDYQDPGIPDLRFADKDAEAFANYLRSNAGGNLDGDHLKVLINQQATMAQFANALDWLWEVCKEGDQVIIYFSGHGDVEKKSLTQPGYLLCWDAPAHVYLAGGALALPMFQDVISTLSVQNKAKVLVITDACRSGKLAGRSVSGAQATASNLAKQFANEIKIMSCQPNEYSIEGEQWGGGRGAFSFHLIEALYGMADSNNDKWVTLQEVGRYLEDRVTTEVAPVSQVPMIIGNRNERLTTVDATLLASIKSGKSNQVAVLTAIETRGLEENLLATLDSNLLQKYLLFKKAIATKHFFEPKLNCADELYNYLKLQKELDPLKSYMKRNYAAALQDEAQQSINIWLNANVNKLACLDITLNMAPIPLQLERAAELLGPQHYMYNTIKARQYLFEGYVLNMNHFTLDEANARITLALYTKSLQLEPTFAIPHHLMTGVYAYNLGNLDSAKIHFKEATKLAPSWVLPYSSFSEYYSDELFDLKTAYSIVTAGMQVDSMHGLLLTDLINIYRREHKYELALKYALRYEASGGETFPCWYISKAFIYYFLHKNKEAEIAFNQALVIDSTAGIQGSAGYFYTQIKNYPKAFILLERALKLDSSFVALSNMGNLFTKTKQFDKAKAVIDQSISLNPNYYFAWYHKGELESSTKNISDAILCYNKAISIDSLYAEAYLGLANCYLNIGNIETAKLHLLKALKNDPNHPEANILYSKMLINNSNNLDAISHIKIAIDSGASLKDLEMDKDFHELKKSDQWKALISKYNN
jgi:tetratricopeptide (TPR) repeat protein